MTTKEFIAKLNESNAELVEKISGAKTQEDAYVIAQENGVTDSLEVFVKEMETLKESISELSDDDLESVAGGASTSEIVTAVTTSVSAAATAASAAV